MGAPRTGPCSPWCSGEEIAAQPWMAAAISRAIAGDNDDVGEITQAQVDVICAEAADSASYYLYEATARMFTGQCGPVTIRPVSRPTDIDTRAWNTGWGAGGWNSSWGSCYYGVGNSSVVSHYGCSNPPEIDLGAFPVTEITLVKIDGVEIPADEYELRDYKTLIRVRPTAESTPTERWGWPTCQINTLPDTQQGTFSVTYRYGQPAPAMGKLAAKCLAQYLALPQLGDDTRYPRRIMSMTRQGVSANVVDVMDLVKNGQTGIEEVDLFVRAANPRGLQQPSAVWSPDMGRPRRQAKASLT